MRSGKPIPFGGVIVCNPFFGEDRIHKIKEFSELPWSALDPNTVGVDWSVGRGGYGFDDWTWTLQIYHEDNSVDVWELPAAIGAAFEMVKRAESSRVRHEIRVALGIKG